MFFSEATSAEAVLLERLDKRVAKLESNVEVARKSFLANLQAWRNSLKKQPLNPALLRAKLDMADAAIADFKSTHRLPDEPELLSYSSNSPKVVSR